jgi:hypothetical protein
MPSSARTNRTASLGRRARGASLAEEKILIEYRPSCRCGRGVGAAGSIGEAYPAFGFALRWGIRHHRRCGERRRRGIVTIEVALEVGRKRVFATALGWPGWCRSGADESAAIERLLAYGPRYAAVLEAGAVRGFRPPRSVVVSERLAGSASTEFGAPGTPPLADDRPADDRDVARLAAILRACWSAFDVAAEAAAGVTLTTGPRGGGRPLEKIVAHVLESDQAYLRALGGSAKGLVARDLVHDAFADALTARARGDLPDFGPRGGKRWSARFAARYAAWHALDHAWEIEDRAVDG